MKRDAVMIEDTDARHLCPECDLLVSVPVLQERQEAHCPRCKHVMFRRQSMSIQTLLALVLTGLLLYIPANLYPVLTLELMNLQHSSSIWGGIMALWDNHNQLRVVAVLVFVSAMLVPLVRLLILLPILTAAFTQMPIAKEKRFAARRWLRLYVRLYEWGMVEIYMLGALVAVIKLADMATVHAGVGLFCYTGLMVTEIAISLKLDEHRLWEILDEENTG